MTTIKEDGIVATPPRTIQTVLNERKDALLRLGEAFSRPAVSCSSYASGALPPEIREFCKYLLVIARQMAAEEIETEEFAQSMRDIRATHRLLTHPYDRRMRVRKMHYDAQQREMERCSCRRLPPFDYFM
jgi:hypothetical protein